MVPAATADGNYWIMGRVDDVLNVSGHRLSTMEVESALVSHPKVAEAAVVGKPDEMRGQAIAAFVTLESGQIRHRRSSRRSCKPTLSARSAHWLGPTISGSPTHSRRPGAARSCVASSAMSPLVKESTGDTSTLEDLSVLAQLRADDEV